jgi:hypothetical protein
MLMQQQKLVGIFENDLMFFFFNGAKWVDLQEGNYFITKENKKQKGIVNVSKVQEKSLMFFCHNKIYLFYIATDLQQSIYNSLWYNKISHLIGIQQESAKFN